MTARVVTAAFLLAAVSSTVTAKKKPAPPQDPPPGYVRSFSEGSDMIVRPVIAALTLTKPGTETEMSHNTFVSLDGEAMREIEKAVSANDEIGVRELVNAGRVFAVASGTRVLIIDRAGDNELGDRAKRLLENYQRSNETAVRICGIDPKSVMCKFTPAPVVMEKPLVFLQLKVRILSGDQATKAGWLYPADVVLPTRVLGPRAPE